MEVILIQDLANLGFKNDIVKVRDGYGRNYLLPQKIAIIANESNRKQLAENLKQQAHKAAKILADAQALEAKLAETVIEVKVKANEDGKIFGTVTTQNISDALKAQEILIDKKVITIAEPIKQVGEYTAQARLHREVKADIKLNVVAEFMKKGIHPENYRVVVFKDMSDGTQFFSRSTAATKDTIEIDGVQYPLIKLEISNTSHPFYTGKSKLVDTAGRVDKFMSRYGNRTRK